MYVMYDCRCNWATEPVVGYAKYTRYTRYTREKTVTNRSGRDRHVRLEREGTRTQNWEGVRAESFLPTSNEGEHRPLNFNLSISAYGRHKFYAVTIETQGEWRKILRNARY